MKFSRPLFLLTVMLARSLALIAGTEKFSCAADGPDAQSESTERVSTDHISAEFQAAIVVRPARIFANSKVGPLKIDEMLSQVWDGRFDAKSVERLTLLYGVEIPEDLESPRGQGRIDLGVVLQTNRPFDPSAFTKSATRGEAVEHEIEGKTVYEFRYGQYKACGFPDERTGLWANSPELLLAMWNAHDVKSPLTKQLLTLDANHDVVAAGVLVPLRAGAEALVKLRPLPAPFQAVNDLPKQLRSASGWIDLTGETLAEIRLTTYDDETAAALKETADEYLTLLKGLWVLSGPKVLTVIKRDCGPEFAEAVAPAMKQFFESQSLSREGRVVTAKWRRPVGLDSAFDEMPIAIERIDETIRFNRRANALSSISKAFALHQAMHEGAYPLSSIRSKDGKPLLSWRVAMLPNLDEQALYDKFRLDEPWDSPHNKPLIDEMPRVFTPVDLDRKGRTRFLAIVGADTVFPPDATKGVARTSDGDSNTIIAVEVGPDKAVIWTKPDDYEFDPQSPRAGLGNVSERGIVAMFGDKRISIIRANVEERVLAALFTRNGREVIRDEDWQPERNETE